MAGFAGCSRRERRLQRPLFAGAVSGASFVNALLGICLSLFFTSATAAAPQEIFSNFNMLPQSEWQTQGYTDTAYTNAGCDDQIAPQNHQGAIVRTRAYSACVPVRYRCVNAPLQIGLGVRLLLPDTPTANLWSVTNISIPLSRTAVATQQTLANYELVFYGA